LATKSRRPRTSWLLFPPIRRRRCGGFSSSPSCFSRAPCPLRWSPPPMGRARAAVGCLLLLGTAGPRAALASGPLQQCVLHRGQQTWDARPAALWPHGSETRCECQGSIGADSGVSAWPELLWPSAACGEAARSRSAGPNRCGMCLRIWPRPRSTIQGFSRHRCRVMARSRRRHVHPVSAAGGLGRRPARQDGSTCGSNNTHGGSGSW